MNSLSKRFGSICTKPSLQPPLRVFVPSTEETSVQVQSLKNADMQVERLCEDMLWKKRLGVREDEGEKVPFRE